MAAGCCLAASARAEPGGLALNLAVETGQHREEMKIVSADTQQSGQRELWASQLAVGLRYGLGDDWFGPRRLYGQSSLGLGLVYALGQVPLHLRQQVLWSQSVSSWLAFEIGLGTGVQLNLSEVRRSAWEFGLPVGIEIAHVVELVYQPTLTLGLNASSERVFGGELRQSIANTLVLIDVMLRVRLLS